VRTRILLSKSAYGQLEIEMVATTKKQYDQTGVDVFDWHQMNRVKPEGYIIAHLMGNSSRKWRRRMYFSMLEQALWGRNDDLAHFALQKCLMHVKCERETLLEPGDGLLESMWSKEKQLRLQNLMYRVIKLCRSVVSHKLMHRELESERTQYNKTFIIVLPKTWGLAVKTAVDILYYHSKIAHWELPVDEELICEAWSFMLDAYSGETQRKGLGLSKNQGGAKLDNTPTKLIPETMKNLINSMTLEQVIFFMREYSHMPRQLLSIFRIEYARKGGAFDLKGPPVMT